jgi:enolase
MCTDTRIWGKKFMIIPVIIRSFRNSNKMFKEIFGNHNRKIFNRFTKNTAVLGTSHVTWKVLQSEP